jgi:hypothetical protein
MIREITILFIPNFNAKIEIAVSIGLNIIVL